MNNNKLDQNIENLKDKNKKFIEQVDKIQNIHNEDNKSKVKTILYFFLVAIIVIFIFFMLLCDTTKPLIKPFINFFYSDTGVTNIYQTQPLKHKGIR